MNEKLDIEQVCIFDGKTWKTRRELYQEMIKLAGRIVEHYTSDVLYDIYRISQLPDGELEGKLWGLRATGTTFDNELMSNERWYTIEKNNKGKFYLSLTCKPQQR